MSDTLGITIIILVALVALSGCQYSGVIDVGQAERVIVTIDRTTQDRGRQSTDALTDNVVEGVPGLGL